jgi:hypothetical protein
MLNFYPIHYIKCKTSRQSAEKHVSRSKALKGHNLPAMGAAHRTNTNTNKALNGRNNFGNDYQSKSAFLQHPNAVRDCAQQSDNDYFKF